MNVERNINVSFHGHSTESDGLSLVPDLVRAAGEAGLDLFGISDHETVEGVPKLYRELDKWNQIHPDTPMTGVAAIEVRLPQGDVVLAKPGLKLDRDFCEWASRIVIWSQSYNLVTLATEAARHHEALTIIVHPAMPLASSVSLADMRACALGVSPSVRPYVGVEVENFTEKLLPINPLRPKLLQKTLKGLDIAKYYFTDFHHSWMVPRGWTAFRGHEASQETFMKAVAERKLFKAGPSGEAQPFEWVRLFATYAKLFTRYEKIKQRSILNNRFYKHLP